MRRAVSLSLALFGLVAMARAQQQPVDKVTIGGLTNQVTDSATSAINGITETVNARTNETVTSVTNQINSTVADATAKINSTATSVSNQVDSAVADATAKVNSSASSLLDSTVNLQAWWSGGNNFEKWGEQYMQPRNTGVARDGVGVLCQPSVVTPGTSFNVQLWYTQSHPREADLIAVALHADTKEYYGGCKIPINSLQGEVDCPFNLKGGYGGMPLKFKTWISPRGEDAPNYITYVMINMPVGYTTEGSCPSIGIQGRSPNNLPPANWVQLTSVPDSIGRGKTATILINYNLATLQDATLNLNLMTWDWATHGSYPIATSNMPISAKNKAVTVNFNVPANAQPGPDGLYFVAYITPVNGDYNSQVAEDRIYKLQITDGASSAPRMRGTIPTGGANSAVVATPATNAAAPAPQNEPAKAEVEAGGSIRRWFGWSA